MVGGGGVSDGDPNSHINWKVVGRSLILTLGQELGWLLEDRSWMVTYLSFKIER